MKLPCTLLSERNCCFGSWKEVDSWSRSPPTHHLCMHQTLLLEVTVWVVWFWCWCYGKRAEQVEDWYPEVRCHCNKPKIRALVLRWSGRWSKEKKKKGLRVKAFYAGVKHLIKLSPEIIWEAQNSTNEPVGLVGKENVSNASYLLMAVFGKAQ